MVLSKKVIIGIALAVGFATVVLILGLIPVYMRKTPDTTIVTTVHTDQTITPTTGLKSSTTTSVIDSDETTDKTEVSKNTITTTKLTFSTTTTNGTKFSNETTTTRTVSIHPTKEGTVITTNTRTIPNQDQTSTTDNDTTALISFENGISTIKNSDTTGDSFNTTNISILTTSATIPSVSIETSNTRQSSIFSTYLTSRLFFANQTSTVM